MNKTRGTVEKRKAPRKAGAHGRNPVAVAAERTEAAALAKQKEKEATAHRMFRNAEKGKWGSVLSEINKENINEIDGRGKTLLMLAAIHGEYVVAQRLIRNGADVNLEDKCGRSALRHALRYEHPEIAVLLKGFGADWKRDLQKVVQEGRVLMVKAMQETLGATDADVAGAREKCVPGIRHSLSANLRGSNWVAHDVHEMGILLHGQDKGKAGARAK